MQQFFIESISNPTLTKEQLRQCKQVLRMKQGDIMRLVDTSGKGIIAEFKDDTLEQLEIIEPIQFVEKRYTLVLVAALIRSERLEWMLQKATEAGVDEIVLWSADHGVVKDFGSRSHRKLERFETIVKEAAEQSFRQFIPVIKGIYGAKELPTKLEGIVYYADIGNNPYIMEALDYTNDINVIVGPEGGFSESEKNFFKESLFKPISLGNNIFRAETASLFICNAVAIGDRIHE